MRIIDSRDLSILFFCSFYYVISQSYQSSLSGRFLSIFTESDRYRLLGWRFLYFLLLLSRSPICLKAFYELATSIDFFVHTIFLYLSISSNDLNRLFTYAFFIFITCSSFLSTYFFYIFINSRFFFFFFFPLNLLSLLKRKRAG